MIYREKGFSITNLEKFIHDIIANTNLKLDDRLFEIGEGTGQR